MRLTAAVGASVVAAAAVHAGPIVTNIAPLRSRLFPRLAGLGRDDHVALTFDDGPDPASTPAFLDELDRLGCRVTFFMLGEMVDRHPALAAEVAAAGHEIAVHGYRHRSHIERVPGAVADDIARALDCIAGATGTMPRWFRPPYGNFSFATLRTVRRLRLEPVLWSCWGRDWRAQATPATVVADIRKALRPGGTVLLHDSDCTSAPGAWRSALGALSPLTDICAGLGVELGPLREHGLSAAAAA
jgi:peptidoglycan/xylan/chitin deacetylase (PgdA/CDA1 family)